MLVAESDLIIVDFEGEPSRPADERRAKSMPLRDVAGLMRSFAYGAETVTREIAARFGDTEERARDAAAAWRGMIEAAFLAGYEAAVAGSRAAVTDPDIAGSAAAPLPADQGPLRGRLRGQQPAGLDRNPRPWGSHHSGHGRTRARSN